MSHSTTFFIVGNPHADRSAFIESIRPALQPLGMEWISLSEEGTDGHFDIPAFQARLTAASTLVLHFPLYWYSPPALVKHWLDSMLTPGWAFPSETSQLRGKTLLVTVTTGAALSSFQPDGSNGSTLEELLLPLERTAAYCGMHWGGIVASQWNPAATDAAALNSSAERHAALLVERLNARG